MPALGALPSQLRFQHINSLNGLHQNSIYSLLEATNGVLWIGTQDGLQCYNGTDFSLFLHDPMRADSLGDSFITDVVEDPHGTIWVGTFGGGLNQFLPEQGTFRRYGVAEGLRSPRIVQLASVGEQLWVGTTQGLYLLDPQRQQLRPVALADDPYPEITMVRALADGGLWIGTAKDGIFVWQSDQWQRPSLPAGDGAISQVMVAPDNHVWLAKGEQLWRYNSINEPPTLVFQLTKPNQGIKDFIFGSHGDVWLGGNGSGLIHLQAKGSDWQADTYHYSPYDSDGLNDNDIFNLLLDRHGNLWVGTRYSGLNRINVARQYFSHLYNRQDPFNQRHNNNYRAILRASSGELFFGTNNAGLFRLDSQGVFHSYQPQFAAALHTTPEQLHLRISDIAEDQQHNLWLATTEGLAQLTSQGQVIMHQTSTLGSIRSVTVDLQQRIWFAAGRQIYRFDPLQQRVMPVPEANQLLAADNEPQQAVMKIRASANGLWVTSLMGAYRYNPDTGERLVFSAKELPHPFVRDLQETADGSVWLATQGGLTLYQHGHFRHFNQQNGLPNNTIYAIAPDQQGKLWFSSNSGISRLDPDTGSVDTFNENEGLQALEFNGGVRLLEQDGSIWFGGINGANHFDPATIPAHRTDVPLALASWQLGDERHAFYQFSNVPHIVVPYSGQVLTFAATPQDFSYPGHHSYSFLLQGLEQDWRLPQPQNTISYTNVAPGHYQLYVRHQLDGNRQTEPQLLAQIDILPPFYRTIEAYLLYAIAILLSTGLMTRHYLLRRRQQLRIQQEINASEERLKLALWGSGGRMWDWHIPENQLFMAHADPNAGTSEPLNLESYYSLIHPDDRAKVHAAMQRYFAGESLFYESEYRVKGSDGQWIWGMDRGKAVEWSRQGDAVRMAGTFTDISLRKQQEDQLRLSYQVLESMGEAVVICGLDYRIIDVNPAFTATTGFSEVDVRRRLFLLMTRGLYPRNFYQQIETSLLQKGHWSGEMQVRTRYGQPLLVWMDINQVLDNQGHTSHLVLVFTDITARKKAEEDLRLLANYDPLTGLPNRTLFGDRLQHALQQAQRQETKVALLFLDLDRFKNINDSKGHQVGDQLLKAVAERLKLMIRKGDTVARIGGDEFTIILEGVRKSKAATVIAEKILEVMKQPFLFDGTALDITTSIGISMYPEDANNTEELLKYADTAMYHAKSLGRNNFQFYTSHMNAAAIRHLQLESGLKQALLNQELYMEYQPQYAINTGEMKGMEALLRWRSPQLGSVSPAEFIPLAEETGQINAIGTWVMRQVCQQLALWQQQGLQLVPVAVNLSAKQLHHQIIEEIQHTLEEHQLDACWLELELTESAVMQQPEESITILTQLQQLGLKLAVDDFGTGYSSLAYLKRFPIHTLKIDKEFVRDISEDPEDAAITSAIIALAHSLELQVVAEGVETQAQLDFLALQGCDLVQGYLLGKPMPESECRNLLPQRQ